MWTSSDIDIELILPHNMYKASKRGEDPLLDRFEQLHLEYIWVFDTDTGAAMFTSNSRKGCAGRKRIDHQHEWWSIATNIEGNLLVSIQI